MRPGCGSYRIHGLDCFRQVRSCVFIASRNATGERVKEKPVTVQDFNATIAAALGLPHELVVMSPSGRPFKFADQGKPVEEVFA
jgi:hypothetical protein